MTDRNHTLPTNPTTVLASDSTNMDNSRAAMRPKSGISFTNLLCFASEESLLPLTIQVLRSAFSSNVSLLTMSQSNGIPHAAFANLLIFAPPLIATSNPPQARSPSHAEIVDILNDIAERSDDFTTAQDKTYELIDFLPEASLRDILEKVCCNLQRQ